MLSKINNLYFEKRRQVQIATTRYQATSSRRCLHGHETLSIAFETDVIVYISVIFQALLY